MQAGLDDSNNLRPSVLITGCNGYVGRNLVKALEGRVNFIGVDCVPGGNESELIDLRDGISLHPARPIHLRLRLTLRMGSNLAEYLRE
ncbi:MAG: hypothetical protein Ct9H300mP25_11280 [Acidobacteriota bacterium]|nr:MAG: hypothetical protein Ct9H300mP25_11280 [Acidobacteriota bacterium]